MTYRKENYFMNYKIIARDVTVTDALEKRISQKIGKLDRFMPEKAEALVKLSAVKHQNRIEVTIPLKKRTLRAEVLDNDMFSALDKIVDVLEKQLVKYKSRLRDRARKDQAFKEEFNSLVIEDDSLTSDNLVIERTKKFAIKPMDPEEAIMEMELLGHSFYVFLNPQTDEVNVVYKRKDDSYGLIEPQFE